MKMLCEQIKEREIALREIIDRFNMLLNESYE